MKMFYQIWDGSDENSVSLKMTYKKKKKKKWPTATISLGPHTKKKKQQF